MVKFWYGMALCVLASHAQAACSDTFYSGRPTVQICIGNACETAVMSRSCGNVEAASQNYEAQSVLWIFRQRFHDIENEADDEYAVLHDPLDPNDIPLQIVDGRPTRVLYEGVPLVAKTVQNVTCVPKSSTDACDFINLVLEKVPAP